MSEGELTHLDTSGSAHMVDVSEKSNTARMAIASGTVKMKQETLALVVTGNAKKGDVIATARIAGIMAAKRTHELIPLCHPLALSQVTIEIKPDAAIPGLHVVAMAKLTGQTGVEMEALTAVSVACLTIYDMAKASDKSMVIGDIHLNEKHGGKTGVWKETDEKPKKPSVPNDIVWQE